MKPYLSLPFEGQADKVFARQVKGLTARLTKMNCRSVVIGLSGGLDSTLALLVSYETFKRQKWDMKGIHLFTMPGFGTTKRTKGNAELLAEGLGLEIKTIDITKACKQHFKDICYDPKDYHVVFENAQARERTQILFDIANMVNGIVIGTGDMSEIALGWCTFNGDHMANFGVNSGVPKTTVREVCGYWAKKNPGRAADAINDIILTPISPELVPGQVTEDKIGPYELHDHFMMEYCGFKKTHAATIASAKKAFKGKYDAATVEKWYKVFKTRLVSQAFKRNCAPDGIKIFDLYFGPYDWHLPSV